jgi:hypothetical protein
MKWSMTICFVVITSLAWGAPFVNPPEDNPNITWETQFSYQRNIFLDFNVNPIGSVGAIPGADYEGYDDPKLWDSDYVEFTGAVEWNESLGAVGIFDSQGSSSGSLIIHIDNWIRDWPVKHLYDEVVWFHEGAAGSIYQDYLGLPEGYTEGDFWGIEGDSSRPSGEDLWWNYWVEIEPNPPWEDKVINFSIGDGGSVYVKSIHIATECVPEPATLALLGLGGVFSVISRKRKTA